MSTTGSAPRVAGVIGSPVHHSLSPVIHQAAFDRAGINWVYSTFEVAEGHAGDAIAAMRALELGGLSVTMPHKAAAAGAVDRLDPSALALRSINTVSWEGDELVGSSTDGAGFVASLRRDGIDVAGARIAIIGAGGAARSLIDALGKCGAADITVLNRTPERAVDAASLSSVASVGVLGDIGRADIVVNATNVGMGVDADDAEPADLPCDPELLRADQVVTDLVYHPIETAWMRAASARGATVVDGLGMLVGQAALQQELWLGTAAQPDADAMRQAAEAELLRRRGDR